MKYFRTVFFMLFFSLVSVAMAGEGMKGFVFKTIDGNVIDSRDLRGSPVVVNIGAHW